MFEDLEYREGRLYRNGRHAGWWQNGYRHLSYKGRRYLEHRVVWFIHHGYWPDEVDHINQNRCDNRIENLRAVTHSTNMRNQKKFKGFHKHSQNDAFVAQISHKRKCIHLGSFKTEEGARRAYNYARAKLESLYDNTDLTINRSLLLDGFEKPE